MPANKGLFSKYPNPIWVETGSWHGDGIQQAIDEGFTEIYSIELSVDLHKRCSDRFKDVPFVHLIQGDSHLVLDALLSTLHQPITFWLDGHFSGGDTAMGKYNSPLMQELDCIARHEIKTHTILIDDLRDWYKGNHGFDVTMMKDKIRHINPDYRFFFEDGVVSNDILVAKI
jgi:hypothetical protein